MSELSARFNVTLKLVLSGSHNKKSPLGFGNPKGLDVAYLLLIGGRCYNGLALGLFFLELFQLFAPAFFR